MIKSFLMVLLFILLIQAPVGYCQSIEQLPNETLTPLNPEGLGIDADNAENWRDRFPIIDSKPTPSSPINPCPPGYEEPIPRQSPIINAPKQEREKLFDGGIIRGIKSLFSHIRDLGQTTSTIIFVSAIVLGLGFINSIMVPIGGPDWARHYVSGSFSLVRGILIGLIEGITGKKSDPNKNN